MAPAFRSPPPERGEGFGWNAVELAPAYAVRPRMIGGFGRPGTITLVVEFKP